MCVRRKQRNLKRKQMLSKNTQTKIKRKKRKRKCCFRCWSKISRWCCRKFGRCVRKKLFRIYEPRWDDYEFTGFNTRSFKDNISSNEKQLLKRNSSIVTLYKNYKPFSKTNISLKHFRMIEGLEANDLKKKFSVRGSKETILEQFLEDYKKGNLSSFLISNKFNPKKLDKNQLNKLLDTYTRNKLINKPKSLLSLTAISFDDIKKRLSIQKSNEKSLNKLIADYQKANLLKSGLSKKRKLDFNNLNKGRVTHIFGDLKLLQRKNNKVSSIRSKLNTKNSLSRLKGVFKDAIGE